MNKPAAIYARVSSDRQKENQTIASQRAVFMLDREKRRLSGYHRAYPFTKLDLVAIDKLMDELWLS